jgi:hypothetical protein
MVLEIDPARLASMLSRQEFFCADRDLPAKRLSGNSGGLVWDQNAPNHRQRSIVLQDVWHPRLLRRVSITISFVRSRATAKFEVGARMVANAHAQRLHVICGPEAHSHLVAGTLDGDYFVWDPDDTERSVEENLAGGVTLRRLFDENANEPIEFWEYRVQLT